MAETFAAAINGIINDHQQSVVPPAHLANKCTDFDPAQFSLIPTDLVKEVKRKAAVQCEVPGSVIEDIFPCTPYQKGLMASSTSGKRSPFAQAVLEPEPSISVEELCEAWNIVDASTPALRTRIVSLANVGTFQVVLKPRPIWQEQNDLEEYLEWDRCVGIRYGGPLCWLGRTDRHVIVSLSHAIYDNWTLCLLCESMENACAGRTVQHRASIKRFITSLTDSTLAFQQRYWSTRLSGAKDASKFPPALSDNCVANPILSDGIAVDGSVAGDDTYVTALLRAAWALCLSRVTGSNKVLFGIIQSSRDHPKSDISNLVGSTIASVPCVYDVSNNRTGQSLVDDFQSLAADMLPFIHLDPRDIRTASEDSDAAYDFQNLLAIHLDQTSSQGHNSRRFLDSFKKSFTQPGQHNVGLIVNCHVTPADTMINLNFDPHFISRRQVQILSQQYAHAIAQLSLHNKSEFSQLGALSCHEHALIERWNSHLPKPLQVCLHEQIRQVARQQPQAPAVESWDAKVSYAQLNELSDRLALYLISTGVQPEMILPLFLEKSTAAVVSILGVLKAGGALAFMTISQPKDRLEAMFRDVQASVVLCSTTLLAPVKSLISGQNVISIDMSFIRALPPATSPVRSLVTPSSAATVTFTSGSTGTPKGVVLSHQSIATAAYHVSAAIGLSDQTRSFQFSNFIFDNAMGDLAITLSRGGCMCIPSDRERDEDLVGTFNRMQCNLLIIVPSLASTLTPSQLPTLRKLLVAGESITRGIIETWGRNVCLINGYGPTEATAWYVLCCPEVTIDLGSRNRYLCSSFSDFEIP